MDQLLYLLLELKRAQLMLSQAQSARTARTEQHAPRTYSVATVSPVSSTPKPITSTVTPAPSQQTADFATQVEQYVVSETNAFRAQNGLAPLTSNSLVASIARAHSNDMLAKNYFEHTNLSGCNPGCRLTGGGYAWKTYGENIHWMQGYKLSAADTARKIVNDWINSPGHRANLLGSFTYVGVGVAVSGDKVESTADYTTQQ